MKWKTLRLEFEGAIALLTLSDPDRRNAMSEEMSEEFPEALSAITSNGGVRALVVTGEGSTFSAGGSYEFIEANLGRSRNENQVVMHRYYRNFLSIRNLFVPSIAAVNGAAIGAGGGLALACDLRLASSDLVMAFPFVKLGLPPGLGLTHFLPRFTGLAAAQDLLITGRKVLAEEALRLGLINRLVAPETLLDEAFKLANEVASSSFRSILETRRLLDRPYCRCLSDAMAEEAAAQARLFAGEDVVEGVKAAREKRSPEFSEHPGLSELMNGKRNG